MNARHPYRLHADGIGEHSFRREGGQENTEIGSQVWLSVLVSLLVAVIKHPNKSDFGEKGPILVHSSRSQFIITDK